VVEGVQAGQQVGRGVGEEGGEGMGLELGEGEGGGEICFFAPVIMLEIIRTAVQSGYLGSVKVVRVEWEPTMISTVSTVSTVGATFVLIIVAVGFGFLGNWSGLLQMIMRLLMRILRIDV
jgi:hypothetical protein